MLHLDALKFILILQTSELPPQHMFKPPSDNFGKEDKSKQCMYPFFPIPSFFLP